MSQIALSFSPFSSARFRDRMSNLMHCLGLALQVRSERQRLSGLDNRELEDVGLSRAAATAESSRAFWDLPSERSLAG